MTHPIIGITADCETNAQSVSHIGIDCPVYVCVGDKEIEFYAECKYPDNDNASFFAAVAETLAEHPEAFAFEVYKQDEYENDVYGERVMLGEANKEENGEWSFYTYEGDK